jgi:hypothetical protein
MSRFWKNCGVSRDDFRVKSMMHKHVKHLLTAYVHDQLSRLERNRVAVHVRMCADCRDALRREERLAQDIARDMPRIGQLRRGQLSRLWPAIWLDFRTPRRLSHWLPSYGVVLALMLLCAFVVSSLFTGQKHAVAAPFQAVPADVRPTVTPVYTIEPGADVPKPSETASARLILPLASPAPHAGPTLVMSIQDLGER